ncbi:MAG: nucleoside triphosphate pyrophosphohydrolase [Chloroflexi bacterium]|nr:nucleoside triphosphate pyrophosphohydrolase [Chloroflexota bacterium]
MADYKDLESFETFLAIIARLRGPDGCPWDKKQTHATLRKYLLEETHEALEAMDADDPKRLAEELGDVLLQVGLNAQIGRDNGTFTIKDVLRTINAKLIHRHPHVFGEVKVSGADEVVANWEKLKAQEKGERQSALDGVQRSLPGLAYSQEIQGRAAKLGFEWTDMAGVLDKVREELGEFERAKSQAELEHELGDIFAALVNIGRRLNMDVEGAMRKANRRFERRFRHMEESASAQGKKIEELPLERQEELWQAAKRATG